MASFKDHFSGHADRYARYRPQYPAELFDFLAGQASAHDLAIDCACGNGQASAPLAVRFRHVIAADASIAQLVQARPQANIFPVACTAERLALRSRCADLLVVAQAAHWFDFDAFHREVSRVVRPGGVVAVWAYGLASISPDIDRLVYRLYAGTLGEHWPPERRYIDESYQTLPFPYDELPAPRFDITLHWTLDELLGYFETWSALQRYRAAVAHDPLPALREQLSNCWNSPDERRSVIWPVYLKVGRP